MMSAAIIEQYEVIGSPLESSRSSMAGGNQLEEVGLN